MKRPECLAEALKLRVPVFKREEGTTVKVEALEEYMLVSAFWVGEMHEERAELENRLRDVTRDWNQVVGWEPLVRNRTEAAVDAAKAKLRPDLQEQLEDLRHWIKQLTREIDRLDNEAKKVSRTYTFVTGS